MAGGERGGDTMGTVRQHACESAIFTDSYLDRILILTDAYPYRQDWRAVNEGTMPRALWDNMLVKAPS